MAEADGSPEMSPDQPAGQEAVAAVDLDPEPEAPGPAAPALRWLPGDPSPRGRSQSDLSSASSRGRPLRVHISGSVDGLDKASIANSDGPPTGSQTPPFKRKGKLSTIGKIFKPWKWRKKKTSDKFRETSAVLERKISTRQSREELIRRGLLKELPDQDGDVTVNFENSNGHMIHIGEESTQEENVGKPEEGDGPVSEKTPPREEKAEDKTDPNQLLWTEEPTSRTTPYSSADLTGSREHAQCFATKDELGKAGPQLLTPGQAGDSSESFSAPEGETPREYQSNDSDSDGPILYTDDDEEEDDDDDGSGESALASKIRRRDTLAIKLGNRPSKKELEDKNILQRTSEEERQEIRQQIGTNLVRRLSQRPTTEELEQRNILRQKNEEEEQEAKMELKRRLSRKLSLRPSVAELQARRILRFNEYVEVTDSPDYDRRADKPWARLTPADKATIRKELNEFKSTEMEVHEESRQFTRFHRP
ncbi:phosphatase and actin regulator 2 isoform X8 [Microtus pennsylvanicus]|uniref:phosphatase and actin regulator 2 isoform X8 n=1 Tax=Microtus pennsylvanicus TaxID=10058 RepID=UPI003F6C62D5